MERMLLNFQSDLGSISSEILSLQQQSVHMNIKLKNRQSIRGELTQFVDEMAVPEEMILTITEASSLQQDNGAFLEQLRNLDHKINFLKEQSFRDAKSTTDVKVDRTESKSLFNLPFHFQTILKFSGNRWQAETEVDIQNPRVPSGQNQPFQKANDKLPHSSKHLIEIQVLSTKYAVFRKSAIALHNHKIEF